MSGALTAQQHGAFSAAPVPAPVVEAWREAQAMRHVSCVDCANWLGGCKAGFCPSLPEEPAHLCGRYAPRRRAAA